MLSTNSMLYPDLKRILTFKQPMYSFHVETSQLICSTDHLTSLYMKEILIVKGITQIPPSMTKI